MTARVEADRMLEFVIAYGEAKFGDEWWLGMARHHLSDEQITEFADVLAYVDPDYEDNSQPGESYLDWLRREENS